MQSARGVCLITDFRYAIMCIHIGGSAVCIPNINENLNSVKKTQPTKEESVMGLLNKLQQAVDSHIESIVSEAIQKRQQDIVRQVKQEIESSDQSWKKVDEAWKGEVQDLQHVVDRLDSEVEELRDNVDHNCVDTDYLEERVSEIDTFDEYTFLERIDNRVTEILENATVTIEPHV